MLLRITGAAIIGGVALIYFGAQELKLAAVAKPLARTMICADLAERGPGNNAHISLTEFSFGNNIVTETIRSRKRGTVRTTSYVPAFPRGDTFAPDSDLRVIVKTDWSDARSLEQLERNGKIQGLVINDIEAISKDTRSLLSRAYPGADIDRCWIVEHGREPASRTKLAGMLGGGGLLTLLGLGSLWRIVRSRSAERGSGAPGGNRPGARTSGLAPATPRPARSPGTRAAR